MATARSMIRSCRNVAKPSPSAATFIQIASHSQSQKHSLLECFVPFLQPRFLHTSRKTQSIRHAQGSAPSRPPAPNAKAFHCSSRQRATVVVHNPQIDDDGQAMTLDITPRAANRLQQIMQKDQNPNLALQITVESGGCHGFQYLMSLITLPPSHINTEELEAILKEQSTSPFAFNKKPKLKVLEEDDVVFAYTASELNDVATKGEGLPKVVMDAPSLELLKGSKIDYTMELIGSQFKIVDNPLATSSCGCGTSFDVKA